METHNYPLVTVGIPTYNGADRIGQAIKAAQDQNYPNLEILITDNASTDNTREVCLEYAASDPRISYHRQETNLGIIGNYDYAMRHASGEYFMWLADDDDIKPGLINTYVQFLNEHDDYVMVCAETNYWKEDKYMYRETGLSVESDHALKRTMDMYWKNEGGTIIYGLIRTEKVNQLVWRQIIGSDWYFMGGLALLGKIKQLDFVGMDYDMGGVSSTHVKLAKTYGEPLIWGYLPYTRMVIGTISDVLYANPVYKRLNIFKRVFAAISCGMIMTGKGMLINAHCLAGWFLRQLRITTISEKKRRTAQEIRGFKEEAGSTV